MTIENWDLLIRKIQGRLNEEEEIVFRDWLESSTQNRHFFEELKQLKAHEAEKEVLKKLDAEAAWDKVLSKYEREKKATKQKSISTIWLRYAAVMVAVLGLSYLIWQTNKIQPTILPTTSDEITLINEAGEVQVIKMGEELSLKDRHGNVTGQQKNDQLIYNEDSPEDELIYNELVVPYGKRFQLALSDGTLVHLNAGSSLKYPVSFVQGENREVFLTGEAYFDVAKDKAHPFLVNTGDVNVRVFGTQFNVSSYPEDKKVSTVLVEGSVGLYDAHKTYDEAKIALLEPGFKGDWNKGGKYVDYEKVDVDVYLGWTEGKLVLKNLPFSAIIAKLERHYDVEIKNSYPYLNDQIFTATFDIETIEDVLNSFKEDTPFTYQIKNNVITISKP